MAAIIPPFRFTTVENKLYRGAYPTLPNFRFLRRLQLKCIISVIPEEPTQDLTEFCKEEGILHHVFRAEKYSSDSVTVSPAIIVSIIQLVLQDENLPMYMHCLDGANVIGIVVMVLRKLQNWTKLATIQEFCRFTRDHTVEKDESEYLSSFSADIIIPPQVPRWLWNGIRIQKHPTMIINSQSATQNTTTNHVQSNEGDTAVIHASNFSTPLHFGEKTSHDVTSTTSILPPDIEKTDSFRQFDERREDRETSIQDELDSIYQGEDPVEITIPRSLSALDLAGI